MGMLLTFVAIFIIVCEHVVPMLIVRRNPEAVLEVWLPPFDVVARFLHPLTASLVRLITADGRRDRADTAALGGTPAESQPGEDAALETAAEQGLIEGDQRRLLQSIVDFGDTLVREVMTPRPDMVAIRDDATLDQLRALFREQEYSRVPVYKENLDNIVGMVFVKDLIRLTDMEQGSLRLQPDLSRLVRPATFVPETKRVTEMLKEFQRKQVQIAIVVDEYGGTAGLVTIEDLLEEIVGEIRDEYDVESEPVVDEGSGSFVFSAKVNIDEIRQRLGVGIEPEGFETVGGYVLTRVGRVPAVGEAFELDGLHVEVLEAERRRIHKVRLRTARVETATER
jgi:CBS domain containing-hemolysin-like protein